jgi:hypothetical protein
MICERLEGEFEGWHATALANTRTYILKYPGPHPYMETHASVTTFVASVMDKIDLGKRVRVTVEVVE